MDIYGAFFRSIHLPVNSTNFPNLQILYAEMHAKFNPYTFSVHRSDTQDICEKMRVECNVAQTQKHQHRNMKQSIADYGVG